MKNQALRFYMHDGASAFRFELAGFIDREGARELDQCWRTASSVTGDRTLIVDMTSVTDADEWGRALLADWHCNGARIVANSATSRALAESIVGEPLPPLPLRAGLVSRFGWTWLSFRSSPASAPSPADIAASAGQGHSAPAPQSSERAVLTGIH